jgi:lysophospholipase L1-like esterase
MKTMKRKLSRPAAFVQKALICLAIPALLLLAASLSAQQPASPSVANAQPPAQDAAAKAAAASIQRAQHLKQMAEDFPWLGRYHDADASLPPPAPGENRVVFMGDSIMEFWPLDSPWGFPGKPYINRGISAQTTPQMVLRFHQDVIALKPKAVVILAGGGDIAGITGPATLPQIEDNLTAMAEMASMNHIGVVLCSVLPAYAYPWSPNAQPAGKIVSLNQWIREYAAANHYVYVDLHSALKDDRGGMPPNLSGDGVHPNRPARLIMAPLTEAGIEKALAHP